MVKFGNRTYCVPAGTVIEQLQQAGYSNLNETWKPGRCVSSTPPLLTKSSMFCSYTDGNICTPVVLLEKLPGRSSHPNTHGKLQTKSKHFMRKYFFLFFVLFAIACLSFELPVPGNVVPTTPAVVTPSANETTTPATYSRCIVNATSLNLR